MWESIGQYITIVSGSPVRVSSANLYCHAVLFQQVNGNTDPIYIMDRSTGNYTTGLGVIAQIPAPTYDLGSKPIILPHASGTISSSGDALNLANFWVDGAHSGDKCMVSILVL
jgi:hypothetical protein